mmetsp:Transcript_5805/g.18619  ORF Transcript_5805/g.18619 Transcript_5805/m.18619 type:complete len:278 (-) Transcript_5805:231-1064(-)
MQPRPSRAPRASARGGQLLAAVRLGRPPAVAPPEAAAATAHDGDDDDDEDDDRPRRVARLGVHLRGRAHLLGLAHAELREDAVPELGQVGLGAQVGLHDHVAQERAVDEAHVLARDDGRDSLAAGNEDDVRPPRDRGPLQVGLLVGGERRGVVGQPLALGEDLKAVHELRHVRVVHVLAVRNHLVLHVAEHCVNALVAGLLDSLGPQRAAGVEVHRDVVAMDVEASKVDVEARAPHKMVLRSVGRLLEREGEMMHLLAVPPWREDAAGDAALAVSIR